MPPKRAGKSKLPVPLPEGFVLKDTDGKKWRLGTLFAKGGFGLIYLAFPDDGTPVGDDPVHVIKVEYHENGTLFTELKFYQRAAKPESIKKWMVKHNLDFLGVPVYWGSGLAEYNGKSYRFMVLDRMGDNLKQTQPNGTFPKEIVKNLGIQLLDVLEYIHENEYVHGDIKAENIMLGYRNPKQVYLADYGLSYRYCPDGTHKLYNENPKKGHNGTIEFTSIDAHKGVALSRRSDLEILAYCILKWLCGKLPWEQNLTDPVVVQIAKTKFMEHLPDSVTKWTVSSSCSREIVQFFTCVRDLAYDEKPNYRMLKQVLLDGFQSTGVRSKNLLKFPTVGCGLNVQKPKDLNVYLPDTKGNDVKQQIQNKIKDKEANEKNLPKTINHVVCSQVQAKNPVDTDNIRQDNWSKANLPDPNGKDVKQRIQNKINDKESHEKLHKTINHITCRQFLEKKQADMDDMQPDNWSKEKAKQRSTSLYPLLIVPKGEEKSSRGNRQYATLKCLHGNDQDITNPQFHQKTSQNVLSAQGRADIYRYSLFIILLLIGILVALYVL